MDIEEVNIKSRVARAELIEIILSKFENYQKPKHMQDKPKKYVRNFSGKLEIPA